LCLSVGLFLVIFLIWKLDADPLVLGAETIKIEKIPFPSAAITPEGAVDEEYYKNTKL
jgi:hypothetical protein